jgi:hypothetical protein
MKLFHCIVVMGAAMGAGCGAREVSAFPPEDGGPDASPDGESPADACPDAGSFLPGPGCQYVGVCPAGTPLAPRGPFDCAHPQELQCSYVSSPPCVCNAGAPLAPTDCATTAEFLCDDWTLPCGCRCAPQAPPSPEACGCDAGAPTDAGPVPCSRGIWYCHSYEPPVGCGCSVPIL